MPLLAPRLLPGFFAKGACVSIEMCRAGYAEVYTQQGAQYGDYGLEEFQRLEQEAQ